jgi:hypothetical protein
MNHINNSKLKNILIKSISYGFTTGFCIGCFPNKLYIQFENKKYKSLEIPLITGLICSMGIILSPFLITNYFVNGVYFDKLIDKYDINIEKHHQYNDKNNMYAFPSRLILIIKSNKKR